MDLFKLYFVLLVKSHIKSYPCPLQILIQHIIKFSFLLEKSIMDGVYVIFILVEHHLSFFSISTSWKSYVLWFILLFIFYLVFRNSSSLLLNGYSIYGLCLTFGQMSFWGATVITNLLSPFPSLLEWICGGYCVHSPSLKRFFSFHFQLPFLLCGFVILHLFYLHFLSSSNPLRNSTNNKIPFF